MHALKILRMLSRRESWVRRPFSTPSTLCVTKTGSTFLVAVLPTIASGAPAGRCRLLRANSGLAHSRFMCSLAVIINLGCAALGKAENHAPVSAHSHSVKAFQLALNAKSYLSAFAALKARSKSLTATIATDGSDSRITPPMLGHVGVRAIRMTDHPRPRSPTMKVSMAFGLLST
jgi:hypothetical protein